MMTGIGIERLIVGKFSPMSSAASRRFVTGIRATARSSLALKCDRHLEEIIIGKPAEKVVELHT